MNNWSVLGQQVALSIKCPTHQTFFTRSAEHIFSKYFPKNTGTNYGTGEGNERRKYKFFKLKLQLQLMKSWRTKIIRAFFPAKSAWERFLNVCFFVQLLKFFVYCFLLFTFHFYHFTFLLLLQLVLCNVECFYVVFEYILLLFGFFGVPEFLRPQFEVTSLGAGECIMNSYLLKRRVAQKSQ